MTMLPMMERELRWHARKASTYWIRSASALLMVSLAFLVVQEVDFAGDPGRTLFSWTSKAAFILMALNGLWFTAGTVVEERERGTLGLLLLTPMRRRDIVIGKMLAASLNAFCGLLALLPILGLPMLMGGVTLQEWGCTMLVLLVTQALSLTIGLWVSCHARSHRAAIGGTLALLLLLLGGFSLLEYLLIHGHSWFLAYLVRMVNPISALSASAQPGAMLWQGLAGMLVLAAGLLTHAAWGLHRTARHVFEPAASRQWNPRGSGRGNPEGSVLHRRQGGTPWLLTLTCLLFPALLFLISMQNAFPGVLFLFGPYLLHLFLKIRFALDICAAIQPARSSGELELLFTTPLSSKDFFSNLWRAFRKKAMHLFVLGSALNLGSLSMFHLFKDGYETVWNLGYLLGILHMAVDLPALFWAGARISLQSRTYKEAVAKTAGWVLGPAALAAGILLMLSLKQNEKGLALLYLAWSFSAMACSAAWWILCRARVRGRARLLLAALG